MNQIDVHKYMHRWYHRNSQKPRNASLENRLCLLSFVGHRPTSAKFSKTHFPSMDIRLLVLNADRGGSSHACLSS